MFHGEFGRSFCQIHETENMWILRRKDCTGIAGRAVVFAHGSFEHGPVFQLPEYAPTLAFLAPEQHRLRSSLGHMLANGHAFERFDRKEPGDQVVNYDLMPAELSELLSSCDADNGWANMPGRFDVILLKPMVRTSMQVVLADLAQYRAYDHVDWHICRNSAGQTEGTYIPVPEALGYAGQQFLTDFGIDGDGNPVANDTGYVAPGAEAYNAYVSQYLSDLIDAVGVFRDPQLQTVTVGWLSQVSELQNYFDGASIRFAREIAIARQLGYFDPTLIERLDAFRAGAEAIIGHGINISVDQETAPTKVPGHDIYENAASLSDAIAVALEYYNNDLTAEQRVMAAQDYGLLDADILQLTTQGQALSVNPSLVQDADLTHSVFEQLIKFDKVLSGITTADAERDTSKLNLPWVDALSPAMQLARLEDPSFEVQFVGGPFEPGPDYVNTSSAPTDYVIQTNVPGLLIGVQDPSTSTVGDARAQLENLSGILEAGLSDGSSPGRELFAKQLFTATALADLNLKEVTSVYGLERPGFIFNILPDTKFNVGETHATFPQVSEEGYHTPIVDLAVRISEYPVGDLLTTMVHELGHVITRSSFSAEDIQNFTLQLTDEKSLFWSAAIEERQATGVRFLGELPFISDVADAPLGWISENTWNQALSRPQELAYPDPKGVIGTDSLRIPTVGIPEALKGVQLPESSIYFQNMFEVLHYLNTAQEGLQLLRLMSSTLAIDTASPSLSAEVRQAIVDEARALAGKYSAELPKLASAAVLASYDTVINSPYDPDGSRIGSYGSRELGTIIDISQAVARQLPYISELDLFQFSATDLESVAAVYRSFPDLLRAEIPTHYGTLLAERFGVPDTHINKSTSIRSNGSDPLAVYLRYESSAISSLANPFGAFGRTVEVGTTRSLQVFAQSLGVPETFLPSSTTVGTVEDFNRLIDITYVADGVNQTNDIAFTVKLTEAVRDGFLNGFAAGHGDASPLVSALLNYYENIASADAKKIIRTDPGIITFLSQIESVDGNRVSIDSALRARLDSQIPEGRLTVVSGVQRTPDGLSYVANDGTFLDSVFDPELSLTDHTRLVFETGDVVYFSDNGRTHLSLSPDLVERLTWLSSADLEADINTIRDSFQFYRYLDSSPEGATDFALLMNDKILRYLKLSAKDVLDNATLRDSFVNYAVTVSGFFEQLPSGQSVLFHAELSESIDNHGALFIQKLLDVEPDLSSTLFRAFPEYSVQYELRKQRGLLRTNTILADLAISELARLTGDASLNDMSIQEVIQVTADFLSKAPDSAVYEQAQQNVRLLRAANDGLNEQAQHLSDVLAVLSDPAAGQLPVDGLISALETQAKGFVGRYGVMDVDGFAQTLSALDRATDYANASRGLIFDLITVDAATELFSKSLPDATFLFRGGDDIQRFSLENQFFNYIDSKVLQDGLTNGRISDLSGILNLGLYTVLHGGGGIDMQNALIGLSIEQSFEILRGFEGAFDDDVAYKTFAAEWASVVLLSSDHLETVGIELADILNTDTRVSLYEVLKESKSLPTAQDYELTRALFNEKFFTDAIQTDLVDNIGTPLEGQALLPAGEYADLDALIADLDNGLGKFELGDRETRSYFGNADRDLAFVFSGEETSALQTSRTTLDARRVAHNLELSVEHVRAEFGLGQNWAPVLSTLEESSLGTYSLDFVDVSGDTTDARRVVTSDGSFNDARRFIDTGVQETLNSYQPDQSGRLILDGDIGDADAISSLNAAFAIQTLIGFFERQNLEEQTTDPALAAVLRGHEYLSLAQIGYGLALDGLEVVKLIKTVATASKTSFKGFKAGSALSAAGSFTLAGIDVALNLASVGLDIYELTRAQTPTEKAVLGTQLAFDVGGVALGTTSLGLGVAGTFATAGSAAAAGIASAGAIVGGAGVIFAGIGIGVTALVQAFSKISEDARAVGRFFADLDKTYREGGFTYDAERDIASAVGQGIVQKVDFRSREVTFGEHHIYRTQHGSSGSGKIDYFFWSGDIPVVVKDEDQKINVREGIGYGSTAQLTDEKANADIFVLPVNPNSTTLSYNWNTLPGATTRHDEGFDVIRRLEQDERFDYDFYTFPSEYIIANLWLDYVRTGVEVRLDHQDRNLVVPDIPELYRGKIYHEVHGAGGQYVLSVNDHAELYVDSELPSVWVLESSNVESQSLRIEGNVVFIGSAKTQYSNLDQDTVLINSPDGDVSYVDFDQQKAMLLFVNGEMVGENGETTDTARPDLIEHLNELNAAGRLNDVTQISNYHAPDGQVIETVYFDRTSSELLYLQGNSDAVFLTLEGTGPAANVSDQAFFYDQVANEIHVVETASHQSVQSYRLPELAGDSSIVGLQIQNDDLFVRFSQTRDDGTNAEYLMHSDGGLFVLDGIYNDDKLYAELQSRGDYDPQQLAAQFGSPVELAARIEVSAGNGGAEHLKNKDVVHQISGRIYLTQGEHLVNIQHDDGLELTIGGQVVFASDIWDLNVAANVTFTAPENGYYDLEALYYQGTSISELKVDIDGQVLSAAAFAGPDSATQAGSFLNGHAYYAGEAPTSIEGARTITQTHAPSLAYVVNALDFAEQLEGNTLARFFGDNATEQTTPVYLQTDSGQILNPGAGISNSGLLLVAADAASSGRVISHDNVYLHGEVFFVGDRPVEISQADAVVAEIGDRAGFGYDATRLDFSEHDNAYDGSFLDETALAPVQNPASYTTVTVGERDTVYGVDGVSEIFRLEDTANGTDYRGRLYNFNPNEDRIDISPIAGGASDYSFQGISDYSSAVSSTGADGESIYLSTVNFTAHGLSGYATVLGDADSFGYTVGDFLGSNASLSLSQSLAHDHIIHQIDGRIYLTAGEHRLDIQHDDGIRLRIGGQEVISADLVGQSSGTYTAAADGYYDIDILYYDGIGPSHLKVEIDGNVLDTETFAGPGADVTPDESTAGTLDEGGAAIYYDATTKTLYRQESANAPVQEVALPDTGGALQDIAGVTSVSNGALVTTAAGLDWLVSLSGDIELITISQEWIDAQDDWQASLSGFYTSDTGGDLFASVPSASTPVLLKDLRVGGADDANVYLHGEVYFTENRPVEISQADAAIAALGEGAGIGYDASQIDFSERSITIGNPPSFIDDSFVIPVQNPTTYSTVTVGERDTVYGVDGVAEIFRLEDTINSTDYRGTIINFNPNEDRIDLSAIAGASADYAFHGVSDYSDAIAPTAQNGFSSYLATVGFTSQGQYGYAVVQGDTNRGDYTLGNFLSDNATLSSSAKTPHDNAIHQIDGRIYLTAGEHRLDIQHDDGIRLRIGGQEVISADLVGQSSGTYTAAADGYYDIDILYYDGVGPSHLKIEIDGTVLNTETFISPGPQVWYDPGSQNFIAANIPGGELVSLVKIANDGGSAWFYDSDKKRLYQQVATDLEDADLGPSEDRLRALEQDFANVVPQAQALLSDRTITNVRATGTGVLVETEAGLIYQVGAEQVTLIGATTDWVSSGSQELPEDVAVNPILAISDATDVTSSTGWYLAQQRQLVDASNFVPGVAIGFLGANRAAGLTYLTQRDTQSFDTNVFMVNANGDVSEVGAYGLAQVYETSTGRILAISGTPEGNDIPVLDGVDHLLLTGDLLQTGYTLDDEVLSQYTEITIDQYNSDVDLFNFGAVESTETGDQAESGVLTIGSWWTSSDGAPATAAVVGQDLVVFNADEGHRFVFKDALSANDGIGALRIETQDNLSLSVDSIVDRLTSVYPSVTDGTAILSVDDIVLGTLGSDIVTESTSDTTTVDSIPAQTTPDDTTELIQLTEQLNQTTVADEQLVSLGDEPVLASTYGQVDTGAYPTLSEDSSGDQSFSLMLQEMASFDATSGGELTLQNGTTLNEETSLLASSTK
ncbi:putative cytotoxin Mcf [Rhodobacteraceae bacterium KLH11]|nr:putative cytotoxin Mcf [Rhodobacteraceae bacterium KLH11]